VIHDTTTNVLMNEFINFINMLSYRISGFGYQHFGGRFIAEDMVVGVIFIVFVVLPVIVAGSVLIGLKILKGGKSSATPINMADETKMIQEIYQSLSRMEDRVNNLETILLERDKQRGERQ